MVKTCTTIIPNQRNISSIYPNNIEITSKRYKKIHKCKNNDKAGLIDFIPKKNSTTNPICTVMESAKRKFDGEANIIVELVLCNNRTFNWEAVKPIRIISGDMLKQHM